MNVSRRFFIGGLAGAFAIGPRRVFAAAPGSFTSGKPALSFGVLSDVHIAFKKGGEVIADNYSTETLTKAFEWFRDNGADAVVIAGDMAHWGLAGELKAVADAWFKVFPNDKAPDGRHVERVFVFGNHDWSGMGRTKRILADETRRKEQLLQLNPKKWWDEIFHEEWKPIFEKTVKGYHFECAHWCNGWCNGRSEKFLKGDMKAHYERQKPGLDPALPFFHVQHPHPRGTVHGSGVWGQDDGTTPAVLSAFPNAITFSGHSHTSLTDERAIWQGAFTAVGCGSLRDVSLNIASGLPLPPWGCENGKTPAGESFAKYDPVKTMAVPGRLNCRQGQLVRVYADRVVFSRREFISGLQLGGDIVMPLPAADNKPFEFERRAAKARAPEFPADAKLVVRRSSAVNRGGKKAKKRKTDVWELSIPAATAVRTARAVRYDITAVAGGEEPRKFAMTVEGARFGLSDPRANAAETFRVACDRVPKGEFKFSVCAVSCWGKVSKPLSAAAPKA